ncbi:MAG: glycosyltransferase family 2 protein [Algoriphagus sp.]|nr:glycosyltransferase family 2 protein [Algoriphagus sp.]
MIELVSILIPNYNKASFLREALNSVLNQSYQNWECIIVDDHSTDNSWEILEEFASLDSRFQIFSRPDILPKGGNGCRNYAFEMSNGEFIQYLDSDDKLDPFKIENQLNRIQTFDDVKTISISEWEFFGGVNSIRLLNKYHLEEHPSNPKELFPILWINQKFIPSFCYLIPSLLIKSEWKQYLVKNQDGDFFFNILLNCDKLDFANNAIGYYRLPSTLHTSRINTFAGFRSDFMVLNSYEKILENIFDNKYILKGLTINYQNYILKSIDIYPVLAKLAWLRLLRLDPKLNFLETEKLFFKLSKYLGFSISYLLRKVYIRIYLFSK